ncbi:HAD family hydrolase [Pseudonocardia pini]|uniref:HAD family hydrolase n=1 Tax=Pseudonocardia pini TaxID=2758030 RepID=UPI0015F01D64|nr:HAD family hydrolase [Pseudonocardia pini]
MDDIRAVAFDVNGTLVDILTDEHDEQIFRALGHTLTYAGIDLRRGEVRDRYFRYLDEQRGQSAEEHPEFDVVAIFARLVAEHGTAYTRALPADRLAALPLFLAETYRGISRRRLELYPWVPEVLTALAARYPLAVVTDGQSAWARAELHQVGLLERFSPVVVSGDHGFRKPDPRLFALACEGIGVPADQTLYVGNDMHRDVFGAREAGMRTVMFVSGQGDQTYRDTVPDHMISDHRELAAILGVPLS